MIRDGLEGFGAQRRLDARASPLLGPMAANSERILRRACVGEGDHRGSLSRLSEEARDFAILGQELVYYLGWAVCEKTREVQPIEVSLCRSLGEWNARLLR